jgi:hypothetical protein
MPQEVIGGNKHEDKNQNSLKCSTRRAIPDTGAAGAYGVLVGKPSLLLFAHRERPFAYEVYPADALSKRYRFASQTSASRIVRPHSGQASGS